MGLVFLCEKVCKSIDKYILVCYNMYRRKGEIL